jgi:hypothetical protein
MKRVLLAVVVFTAGLPASFAHHSITAMYAEESRITLEGEVTQFEFRNPHPVIHLEVVGKDGIKSEWLLEWSSKTRLDSKGYAANVVKPGDHLIVTGGPARDGSKGLFVGRLQRPADGFEYVSTRFPTAR